MLKPVPFYFLRHGQTDWNLAKRLQGQTDIPLNATGRAQALAAKALITKLRLTKVCSSDLSRAYETAEIVTTDLRLPIITVSGIREVTLGEADGRQRGPWYLRWKSGELAIAGAETRADFSDRIVAGINNILEDGELTLIVSHGGVYSALTDQLNIKLSQRIENCMLIYFQPVVGSNNNWMIEVIS
ncbi:MAG: histidine phosphatase family protein [Oceanospirillaceae bacterium]|nr:histidine phosphatase family protein [Oceanospirillaceae bacterium]